MCCIIDQQIIVPFLVVKRSNQKGRRLSFISKGSTKEMTQMNILWSSASEFAGSINDLL